MEASRPAGATEPTATTDKLPSSQPEVWKPARQGNLTALARTAVSKSPLHKTVGATRTLEPLPQLP